MMEEARLSGRGGSVPAAAALAADPGPLAHMLTMRLRPDWWLATLALGSCASFSRPERSQCSEFADLVLA